MRGSLIRYNIRNDSSFEELPVDLRSISRKRDRHCLLVLDRSFGQLYRFIEISCGNIDLFQLQPAIDTPGIDIDQKSYAAVECDRLSLRSAHLAKTRG